MYEFLEHPSEELIRVTARTLNEVFVDSATALFELMTNTRDLQADLNFAVQLEAPEKPLLLIDWLNRLIFLHEVEHVFLQSFHVNVNPAWNLSATVNGQRITERMERRLHAKSATYGQLRWNETTEGYRVEFVIDI